METNQRQERTPVTKKYVIRYLGENNVELPPNYSTDIEGEYKLINLINEPKENYKLAATNEYAKIYKRKVNIKNLLIIIKYILLNREKIIFKY